MLAESAGKAVGQPAGERCAEQTLKFCRSVGLRRKGTAEGGRMAGGGWPLLVDEEMRCAWNAGSQGCAARCSCQRDFILRRDAALIDWTAAGGAPASPQRPQDPKCSEETPSSIANPKRGAGSGHSAGATSRPRERA
jgi:hypothetical protein